MKSRDTNNPHNRFRDVAVEYDDGEAPPPSAVTLIDDHARSILSENDSPDLPFRFSANPYRGCSHACAYCLGGDTPILMADSRTKRIADVEVGDEILGTARGNRYRFYVRTKVLDHWRTLKVAYRVLLADGTELVASGDHRFLTERGWKHVMPIEADVACEQRPFLTTNNSLLGTGHFASAPSQSAEYKRGYLCGMIRGDGTLRRYDYSNRRRRGGGGAQHHFRLALADFDALGRAKRYLSEIGIDTFDFDFGVAPGFRPMKAIRANSRAAFEQITSLIEWPIEPDDEWRTGFLAGIFDAEGSRSQHVLRISNMNRTVIDHIYVSLIRFGFDAVVETIEREPLPIFNVRIRGGLAEHLRFFHSTAPAITRKWDIEGRALRSGVDLRVVSIERLGLIQLFDITTGTGDFIANGVVSHNCYARPTHEYLDLGAGTDFDTKIVVKREAPALLRAAFDKPSWKGDSVMFSGVTDCYQPVEKDLELTKRCLEVCLEYRNPVSVISKSALVERDIDLFLELAKEARFHIAVSLAFLDGGLARAIEPWAPSPERRLKVIETLAKAGVAVSVMCAPIIPGVNDNQLVKLLERAADAGATGAGWVLLRLPGIVKEVFEERVRIALPLAGDKILHRIRETRGGNKLYDARFGVRGRGEGPYAEMIGAMFDTTVARLGMNRDRDEKDAPTTFRRPPAKTNQLSLF